MRKTNEEKQAQAARYWSDYKDLLSVHKVAELHGVSHSTVHNYLRDFGYDLKGRMFTAYEDEIITEYYNTRVSDFDLDELTHMLGRSYKSNVCRRAKELGLSDITRKLAEQKRDTFSKAAKARIKKYGHPKGALGIKHSEETRKLLSEKAIAGHAARTEEQKAATNLKTQKTRVKKGIAYPQRKGCSWKQQWAEFGGKRNYYRSQWELNYARYLEMLKNIGEIKEWEHEPKTFWFEGVKRGTVSYLPDFRVTENDGSIAYHEVKGWMDDKSKTKIKRMAKYHPDVKLVLIDSKTYKALARQVKGIVDGWV